MSRTSREIRLISFWFVAVSFGLVRCVQEQTIESTHRRVARAATESEPCPESSYSGVVKRHKAEVKTLIGKINDGEFDEVEGTDAKKARSYTYKFQDCTLGKGYSEAVVLRIQRRKSGIKGKILSAVGKDKEKGVKIVALKVAFGDQAKTELLKEAETMKAAHAVPGLADSVPEPGPYGWSKNKHYFYMEMPEVGISLNALLIKENNGVEPATWRKYFEQIVKKATALHSEKLETCFVHGDLHFGNIALQKDDPSNVVLIDWGESRRCALPGADKMDPDAIRFAILRDLWTPARYIATCACSSGHVTLPNGNDEICLFGEGKFNAKAYEAYTASKFASFQQYVLDEDWTRKNLEKMQTALAGLVKDPNYQLP